MYLKELRTNDNRVVIKFVFDHAEEYDLTLDFLKELSEDFPKVKRKEPVYIIDLFKKYHKPEDKYCEDRPTVTVFENHFIDIARIFLDLLDLIIQKNIEQQQAALESINSFNKFMKQIIIDKEKQM